MSRISYKNMPLHSEVHDFVMKDCIRELIKDYPEFANTKITYNYIISRIAYYWYYKGNVPEHIRETNFIIPKKHGHQQHNRTDNPDLL